MLSNLSRNLAKIAAISRIEFPCGDKNIVAYINNRKRNYAAIWASTVAQRNAGKVASKGILVILG